jgi:hypothetical protein
MVKHGSRRHRMKRGGGSGDSEARPHGASDATMEGLNEMTDSVGKMTLDLDSQTGGRKSRRKHRHTKKCRHMKKSRKTRKHGGEGVISTALLPFGLFGLQKYFQRNRTAKRGVKGLGNKVKSGFKNIRKML